MKFSATVVMYMAIKIVNINPFFRQLSFRLHFPHAAWITAFFSTMIPHTMATSPFNTTKENLHTLKILNCLVWARKFKIELILCLILAFEFSVERFENILEKIEKFLKYFDLFFAMHHCVKAKDCKIPQNSPLCRLFSC